ncbi:MAG: NAD(P)H-hydrate dehydratase, partial [Cellulosilyticaceae bacterium]
RQLVIWTEKEVVVVMVDEAENLSQDAKVYHTMCQGVGVSIIQYSDPTWQTHCEAAQLIVDALFGTGLSREVVGKYKEVIDFMNGLEKPYKISIDIPSGIQCDTGHVLGCAMKVHQTITFECLKMGLCVYPGIVHAGEVKVVKIGIPPKLRESVGFIGETIDLAFWQQHLPQRPFRSNKGSYGKVLLIGGAKSMAGAISLATKGCMKVGAGLVRVAVPEIIYPIVESSVLEAMVIGCEDTAGFFDEQALERIDALIDQSEVVAVGPGMGRTDVTEKIIEKVLASNKPCVIDADGLYGLRPFLDQLKHRVAPVILTPHPGELSALSGDAIKDILENPVQISKAFVETYGGTLVLKLERSLVVGEGRVLVNTTGNTGLAKGGSGDVLMGMITGFLAQKVTGVEAAALGVYAHGKAAEIGSEQKGCYSLLPHELCTFVEKLFIYTP